jgi:adiponectin receptor
MTSILTLRRPARLFTRATEETEAIASSPGAPSPFSRTPLQKFEDLPVWYQDNPYVRDHYRPVSNSIFGCLYSWTYVHNETLNIYTHLVPAVLSVFAQVWMQVMINRSFPEAEVGDRLIFALNTGAATAAFAMSTFYHTLMNHSFHVSSLWLRIDYVGILALTLGSFFSGIYVGFYEHPHLRTLYWSMIVVLSVVSGILVLYPRLQGPKFRSLRTTAFVLTALSGLAPIGHGLWLYGWSIMWQRSGMPFWFGEGVVYGIGAVFL